MQAGAEVVIADLSDALCKRAVDELAESGPADILVTCAAIVTPARILDFDPEDWARIIMLSPVNGQIANIGRGAVYEDTA